MKSQSILFYITSLTQATEPKTSFTTLLFKFYYAKSIKCQPSVFVVRHLYTYEYSYFQEQKQQPKIPTPATCSAAQQHSTRQQCTAQCECTLKTCWVGDSRQNWKMVILVEMCWNYLKRHRYLAVVVERQCSAVKSWSDSGDGTESLHAGAPNIRISCGNWQKRRQGAAERDGGMETTSERTKRERKLRGQGNK